MPGSIAMLPRECRRAPRPTRARRRRSHTCERGRSRGSRTRACTPLHAACALVQRPRTLSSCACCWRSCALASRAPVLSSSARESRRGSMIARFFAFLCALPDSWSSSAPTLASCTWRRRPHCASPSCAPLRPRRTHLRGADPGRQLADALVEGRQQLSRRQVQRLLSSSTVLREPPRARRPRQAAQRERAACTRGRQRACAASPAQAAEPPERRQRDRHGLEPQARQRGQQSTMRCSRRDSSRTTRALRPFVRSICARTPTCTLTTRLMSYGVNSRSTSASAPRPPFCTAASPPSAPDGWVRVNAPPMRSPGRSRRPAPATARRRGTAIAGSRGRASLCRTAARASPRAWYASMREPPSDPPSRRQPARLRRGRKIVRLVERGINQHGRQILAPPASSMRAGRA